MMQYHAYIVYFSLILSTYVYILKPFWHMPVSDLHLVLSCVDGHVDICRQRCRQLSTNRQAYSH
jgi:hypothetical protein